MSREYNQGILPDYPIQQRLHRCFGAYIGADDERVKEGIRKAEFIQKGACTNSDIIRRKQGSGWIRTGGRWDPRYEPECH